MSRHYTGRRHQPATVPPRRECTPPQYVTAVRCEIAAEISHTEIRHLYHWRRVENRYQEATVAAAAATRHSQY